MIPFERKGSTRELIIGILSEEWPLNAKELFNRVNRVSESGLTYQAVHKTLNQLEVESIVSKKGNDYEISPVWVAGLKEFADGLNARFDPASSKYEVKRNFTGQQRMRFTDYSVFCVVMADVIRKKLLVGTGPNIGIGALRHLYWPLRFNFTDFELFRKMAASLDNGYVIVKNSSPLDIWLKKQWEAGGYKYVKLGENFEGDQDIIVLGESVCEVIYSSETKKVIDGIYSRAAGLGGLFKEYFTKQEAKKEMQIELKITKNPQLADLIRKQVISHFQKPEGEKK